MRDELRKNKTVNKIWFTFRKKPTCKYVTILQPTVPKNQDSSASWSRVGGRHTAMTIKSATAKLTRWTFVRVLRFRFRQTARQTNRFPLIPNRKTTTNSPIKIQCSSPGATNSRISWYHSSSVLCSVGSVSLLWLLLILNEIVLNSTLRQRQKWRGEF